MKIRLTRLACCAALLFGLPKAFCGTSANTPPFAGPFDAGLLAAPPRHETSGIAASHRADTLLWVHDDSGGEPVLYAVDTTGAARGALRLTGAANHDWEDVASFEMDGKAWLLIGDVGDNAARRSHVLLHLVEEPDPARLAPGREIAVLPTWTLRVVYEDGPRDCESVAVDPAEKAIYLLSKRDIVPRLYRVPLAPDGGVKPVTARLVGTVPHLPPPTPAQRALKAVDGVDRDWPTAMDFAPDGSAAVVLTYGGLLYYPRAAGESWVATLARAPIHLANHHLVQAEAVCFSRSGNALFVASEKTHRMLRYDRH